MSETRIAARYARSLYDTAVSGGSLEKVVGDMRNLNEVVAGSREFNQFLHSPLISKENKKEAMKKIFHGFHAETLNLFLLMTSKNREAYIGPMGNQFMQIYNRNHGITEAVVTTASELDKDSLSKIEQFIKSNTGAKTVQLQTRIDAGLLGGLTIMFEGKIYDSSISSQIKKIKKELKIA